MEAKELRRAVFTRISVGVVFWAALFFGTAGTFRYWEAWAFLAVLFTPMGLMSGYLLRNDPELVERRLKAKEKREKQKLFQKMTSLVWITGFVIPGLDHRGSWSTVPLWLVIVADLLVVAGYILFFLVLKENSYAGRTIEVEENQSVISTGPYSLVRHPMYTGATLMLLFAPLALGSWWATLPMLLTPLFLIMRIRDEEEALLEELPGYPEYTQKTKYRLIPLLW